MPVLDPFGIREIYPTHPNRAKPWYLGIGDWEERRYAGIFAVGDWEHYSISTENNIVTINFAFDPTPFDPREVKGRFPVLASVDVPQTILEIHQDILRRMGYMAYPKDWKNVEITLYWRILRYEHSSNLFPALAFSVRGGPHHASDCTGTALYVSLSYAGVAGMSKELGESKYTKYNPSSVESVANPIDHWVGMKGVFYTKANGNPYIELWLDKDPINNLNNWERIRLKDVDGKEIDGKEDSGGWYLKDNNGCGGAQDEKITWGGPGVIFKLNHLKAVDMKWGSIREILPPEGWPLRYLLNARGLSPPFSMRSLAQEYGLTAPISLRQLTELEAERDRG